MIVGHRRFRFGGANIYWLGLDENVGGIAYPSSFRIDDALETAADMGATVVRSHTLGISTGNPLSIEPSLGRFNFRAFHTIDVAVMEACRLGIHLIVPLTDNWNYYEGSYHNFTQWLHIPSSGFFTDSRAIAAFEQYVKVLLTHRDPYTGLKLRDDPTIMAWELGNEVNGMTPSWIATLGGFVHRLAPQQLVAAGQQIGIDPTTLSDHCVGIVDVHYYPPSIAQVESDARQVASAGKVFIAGEYGSIFATQPFLSAMEDDPEVSGAAFWSLFAHLDTYGYEQHEDGYTLHFPGMSPPMRLRDDLIRGFGDVMAGVPKALAPAPGQPLITGARRASPGGNNIVVTWRGATDAASYSVERSSTGPRGPWTTACNRCTNDDTLPWRDVRGTSTSLWYRVMAFNYESMNGPWSPAVKVSG